MIDPLAHHCWNAQQERDDQMPAPGAHGEHAGQHHQGQQQRFNQITARQVFDKWCEYKQEAERHQKPDGGVTREAEPMRGFVFRFHFVALVNFAGVRVRSGPSGSRSKQTYSLILLFRWEDLKGIPSTPLITIRGESLDARRLHKTWE